MAVDGGKDSGRNSTILRPGDARVDPGKRPSNLSRKRGRVPHPSVLLAAGEQRYDLVVLTLMLAGDWCGE